jgi:microcystin-dependent protein
MFCEGQNMPISENETLFQLIGTTYGGDGQETFALPDLGGRLPVHAGNGFLLAETGGSEEVALTLQQTPNHSHTLVASDAIGSDPNPANNLLAESSVASMYQAAAPSAAMSPLAVSGAGGSQPHTNFQPYLCINFIISLFGIFPSQ